MWAEEHRRKVSKAGTLKQGGSWVWNRVSKFDGEEEGDEVRPVKGRT